MAKPELNKTEVLDQPEGGEATVLSKPVVTPPDPRRKKFSVIFAVITVLLIALGIAIYFFYLQPQTDDQSESIAPTVDTTDYAGELIDKIQVAESAQKPYQGTSLVVKQSDPIAPDYRVEPAKYYVTGTFGHKLTVDFDAGADAVSDGARALAEKTANDILNGQQLSQSKNEVYTYHTSGKVVCNVSINTLPVSIACANIPDYAPVSRTFEPYATAFFAAPVNATIVDPTFTGIKTTSKQDGYANTTIGIYDHNDGIGGYAGLFYGKDGRWTFWRGTQSLINCTDYDTYALQKSFEGDNCYDQTVKDARAVKVTAKPQ